MIRYAGNLETLYQLYNHRKWVHPDPLEFVYRYSEPQDQEVVGLIASCLAYGRVQQILASVERVLAKMGSHPARYLRQASDAKLLRDFEGFRHRFQTHIELVALLCSMREAMRKFGSLEACFAGGFSQEDETVLPALGRFVDELDKTAAGRCGQLLPRPALGSACKRLNLYIRWMVRQDEVDPGVWSLPAASKLVVPLDTHMHRIGRELRAVTRVSANQQSALELTAAFRRICPADPVRYDFCLTRLGIRGDTDFVGFIAACKAEEIYRA